MPRQSGDEFGNLNILSCWFVVLAGTLYETKMLQGCPRGYSTYVLTPQYKGCDYTSPTRFPGVPDIPV